MPRPGSALPTSGVPGHGPVVSKTAFLRARLSGMSLNELQEFNALVNADFQRRAPGEWKNEAEMYAVKRLFDELQLAVKRKVEYYLGLAHEANGEGGIDGSE